MVGWNISHQFLGVLSRGLRPPKLSGAPYFHHRISNSGCSIRQCRNTPYFPGNCPLAAHCSGGRRRGCHAQSQTLAGVTTSSYLPSSSLFTDRAPVVSFHFGLQIRPGSSELSQPLAVRVNFFFSGCVQATGLWLRVVRSSCSCFAPAAICHFARTASALSALSKHLPVAIWVQWCSLSNLPACWQQKQAVPRRQASLKVLGISFTMLHLHAPSLASLASWYLHLHWGGNKHGKASIKGWGRGTRVLYSPSQGSHCSPTSTWALG